MKYQTVPIFPYYYGSGSSAESAVALLGVHSSIVDYLFNRFCLEEVRQSLVDLGLPGGFRDFGRVSDRVDIMSGERNFYLDRGTPEERLLFTAQLTVKGAVDRQREMYCIKVSTPKAVLAPSTTQPGGRTIALSAPEHRQFAEAQAALTAQNISIFLLWKEGEKLHVGARSSAYALTEANIQQIQDFLQSALGGKAAKVHPLQHCGVGKSHPTITLPESRLGSVTGSEASGFRATGS
ncbi:hypothetical protein [Lewinella sp. IMCC34183]|uniref:hypothetical protein n=1 Tax=Lewinella sp. IMCC34183 TaxID=2248762 RepID=UPI000E25ADCE|nr:hypothetical protein [Lewinella sp. IMCC34183]